MCNYSLYKAFCLHFIKKIVKEALKTGTSSEGLISIRKLYETIREVDFGTLVLALYCYSGDNK